MLLLQAHKAESMRRGIGFHAQRDPDADEVRSLLPKPLRISPFRPRAPLISQKPQMMAMGRIAHHRSLPGAEESRGE